MSVTVVIPTHSARRWLRLVNAVHSVRTQSPTPEEIVVVVDHNESLYQRARRELVGVTLLRNRFDPGLAGARNTGAFHSRSVVVAFLDDDLIARPGWLAGLVEPFADPGVAGTGGAMRAIWPRSRPSWMPDELLWVFGDSFQARPGTPGAAITVRDVSPSTMAVRRDAFMAVGGFPAGARPATHRSRPEDVEFCLRVSYATGDRWVYVPGSVSAYAVDPRHVTLTGYLARCYQEGRGTVALVRQLRGRDLLGPERTYLRRTLPLAFGRVLTQAALSRDIDGARRAGAMVIGVAAAVMGGAIEALQTPIRVAGPPALDVRS